MIVKYIEPKSGISAFLSEIILDKIRAHIASHSPKEFGGIFSGLRRESSYFIIDIVLPEKYENSRVQFTRHPDNLNIYLKNVYGNTSGAIEYLGEWHSHPGGSNRFSGHDLTTMKAIASDDGVKMENPLLLIIAHPPKKTEFALYLFRDKMLHPMHRIEL
jgi:[CysO sulfur-carrier protein]-S-L-cysteine hydrolase